MSTLTSSYYSSSEKDLVRSEFERPLLEAIHQRRGRPLRYFGLPGEEALDLKAWGHLLDYVAAVEVFPNVLEALEQQLDTHYSNIRYRTHLGDADKVILGNGSWRREEGSGRFWRWVSTSQRKDVGSIWDFDVVYLDYFGKFLPYDRGGRQVRNRALALRRLFDPDRQDAWKTWLLMVCVESRLYGPQDRKQMRDYLGNVRGGAADPVADALDFLLESGLSRRFEAARLVHGTMAYIVSIAASNADVKVRPRGTIMYRGAGQTPMLHFAYEIESAGTLSGHQDPLPLLVAPFVQVRSPAGWPWFELVAEQQPGQTEAEVRAALDFLGADQVEAMVAGLN